MVDQLDIKSESLGLWPATKIVEHNAGRCTVPGCKCIDFLALKYELLTCKCCGHHVKKHVMNKNRVPRETNPAYMPASETDLAAQITNKPPPVENSLWGKSSMLMGQYMKVKLCISMGNCFVTVLVSTRHLPGSCILVDGTTTSDTAQKLNW